MTREIIRDWRRVLSKYRAGQRVTRRLARKRFATAGQEYEAMYEAMGELVMSDTFSDEVAGDMAQTLWTEMVYGARQRLTARYWEWVSDEGRETANYRLETFIQQLERLGCTWQRGTVTQSVIFLRRLKNQPL